MTLLIRPAHTDDCPALAEIDRAGNPSPWSAEQFAATLAEPYSHIQVAEQNGQVAAFIVWQTVFEDSELHLIATAPAARRQGLAAALMETWLAAGSQNQVERYFLEVRAGNTPAQQLYRQYGFQETARRRDYYPLPSGREDAVIMEKSC